MIKFTYPEMVIAKARAICERINVRAGTSQRRRDEMAQEEVGLTHRYLSRVGVIHREPSNRVLLNLGYELWLRDPETGDEVRIDLKEHSPWDWNPGSPRMRAESTNS